MTGSNDGADDEDAADSEKAGCELVALTEELWEALAEELVSVGAWEVLLEAAEVVLASLLLRLLDPGEAGRGVLAPLANPVLRNWNGIEVGRVRAAEALRT